MGGAAACPPLASCKVRRPLLSTGATAHAPPASNHNAHPPACPAGALDERRLQVFLERFEGLRADREHDAAAARRRGRGRGGGGGAEGEGQHAAVVPPFHYGSHYSNAGGWAGGRAVGGWVSRRAAGRRPPRAGAAGAWAACIRGRACSLGLHAPTWHAASPRHRPAPPTAHSHRHAALHLHLRSQASPALPVCIARQRNSRLALRPMQASSCSTCCAWRASPSWPASCRREPAWVPARAPAPVATRAHARGRGCSGHARTAPTPPAPRVHAPRTALLRPLHHHDVAAGRAP